jgi:hypothetical protein
MTTEPETPAEPEDARSTAEEFHQDTWDDYRDMILQSLPPQK